MNCQKFYQQIDNYIEDELDARLVDAVHDHLNACPSCQQRAENRLQIKKSLSGMSAVKMRDGFTDKVINHAVQANNLDNKSSSDSKFSWGFSTGFITSLAASFAIWFLVNTFYFTQDNLAVKAIQALNIELYESKTVNIVFNSPQAMTNATVSLILPNHIEIEGYANKRSLNWSTQIVAGRNVLSLPMRALNIGQGELITKVEFGGKSKMIRFNVNVTQMHQSNSINKLYAPRNKSGVTA